MYLYIYFSGKRFIPNNIISIVLILDVIIVLGFLVIIGWFAKGIKPAWDYVNLRNEFKYDIFIILISFIGYAVLLYLIDDHRVFIASSTIVLLFALTSLSYISTGWVYFKWYYEVYSIYLYIY